MSNLAPRIEEHRFVSSDDVGLRYISCGDGYPVVLSTPIGLHLDFWKPLFATRSAERFRFIALQSRGLWGSQASHDPANDTVSRHGLDIAELVGHEELNDYAMIGYCGGSAPLIEALQSVAKVPGNTLLISTLFRRDRQELIVRRVLERFEQSQRPSAYRMILSVAFQAAVPEFQSIAEDEICTTEKLPMYLRQLNSLYSFNFPNNIRSDTSIRVFLSSGDIDPIKESSCDYVNRMGGDASKIETINDSDHFYLFNQPERAIDLISNSLLSNAGAIS
ncbi:alpha/beta hydrolase [uncultured Erythrobacter sp.]|uniref:alpha/beta fold hydrolase n=1 Tax=uncultured Erythrobacter sp. TaxID=263913 RepID=UPI00263A322F|nr:alpha/beta hydrolase [uncultured Erythrobacter sp.]